MSSTDYAISASPVNSYRKTEKEKTKILLVSPLTITVRVNLMSYFDVLIWLVCVVETGSLEKNIHPSRQFSDFYFSVGMGESNFCCFFFFFLGGGEELLEPSRKYFGGL